MRLIKSFIAPVSGLLLLSIQGFANAALVDVCTFGEGCGPDFAANGTVTYDPGTDELKFTSSNITNVAFVVGSNQIDQTGQEGVSLNVTSANGFSLPELLEIIMHVDNTGNLYGSSSVNMNGRIIYFDSGLQSITAGGVALDGALVKDGVVDEINATGNILLLRGQQGAGSILAANGMTGVHAEIALLGGDQFDFGVATAWTSTGASINLVAPLPAGAWLFISGLGALLMPLRKRRK